MTGQKYPPVRRKDDDARSRRAPFASVAASLPALAAVLAAAAAVIFARPVQAQINGYQFTNITDTTGHFGPVEYMGDRPVINETGTIAYWTLETGGIYRIYSASADTGEITKRLDTGTGPFQLAGGTLSINDLGSVAFTGNTDSGPTGVYRSDADGQITTIADSSGPFMQFLNYRLFVNNSGTVAFAAIRDDQQSGVFTGNGGAAVASLLGGSTFDIAGLSNSGSISFRERRNGVGMLLLTRSADGQVTEVVDTRGPLSSLGLSALNDSGEIAFIAGLDAGGSGVYRTRAGGPITPIALSSYTTLLGFRDYVSVNDLGDVAFVAVRSNEPGGEALFVSDGENMALVIGQQDPLFGSRVLSVQISDQSLNNTGQLVFRYLLYNGVYGVALATPMATPEPATVALFAAGLLPLAGIVAARKRRNST
jgi:hypothetical protein